MNPRTFAEEILGTGQCKSCGDFRVINREGLCFYCSTDRMIQEVEEKRRAAGLPTKENSQKEEPMAKRGICKKCGRELTLYAEGFCKKCYKEEYGKPKKTGEDGGSLKITLDFSPYPELYEALKEKAREEFRDVAHQALWCIRHYVKEQELLSGKEV